MDNRKSFNYRGCKVDPKGCLDPNWGRCSEPIDFHDGRPSARRWWTITSPCGKWLHARTKADAREAVDWLEEREK